MIQSTTDDQLNPIKSGASKPSRDRGFLPTLGGKQFWTDWRWADQWRLQRFCYGDVARILDDRNRLVKVGGFEKCHQYFQDLISRGTIQAPRGRVAILLHGLCRTRTSLRGCEKAMRERTQILPIRLSYSSTRQTLEQNALALRFLIDHLSEVEELNFVCHSMGNLLVRRWLFDTQKQNPQPACRRFVMIAPPNQGSRMARWLKYSLIFNSVAGVGGRQFTFYWDGVSQSLATPNCEFGVIAGAQQRVRWFSNPFLPGTDDWTVSTGETYLEGESDRLEDHFFHSSIMAKKKTIDATLQFLETGRFAPLADDSRPACQQTNEGTTDEDESANIKRKRSHS